MFGYESLQKDFDALIAGNHLSHAYLFYGEPQIGKFLFAQELASKIAHPSDIRIMDVALGQDTDTESLGIEKVRELEVFLYRRPTGKHRIALIRDAQWLTDQAQNALLKLLEEPPASGILLATAADPDTFLPAVRSRFQLIFMPVVGEERILDFLSQYDIIEDEKLQIARKARGRVGKAKTLAEVKNDETADRAAGLARKALKASSGAEKKALSDELIDFFTESTGNADAFIEACIQILDPQKEHKIAHAVHEFAYNLHTTTIQKRIHIKKLLWTIQ